MMSKLSKEQKDFLEEYFKRFIKILDEFGLPDPSVEKRRMTLDYWIPFTNRLSDEVRDLRPCPDFMFPIVTSVANFRAFALIYDIRKRRIERSQS